MTDKPGTTLIIKPGTTLIIKNPVKNHPWDHIVRGAQEQIDKGHWVLQKFSCGKCGVRLTIYSANVFHTHGACDACGHLTDIRKAGCNYTVLQSGAKTLDVLAQDGFCEAPPAQDRLTIKVTGNAHEEPKGTQ